jgi:hypothetical protein
MWGGAVCFATGGFAGCWGLLGRYPHLSAQQQGVFAHLLTRAISGEERLGFVQTCTNPTSYEPGGIPERVGYAKTWSCVAVVSARNIGELYGIVNGTRVLSAEARVAPSTAWHLVAWRRSPGWVEFMRRVVCVVRLASPLDLPSALLALPRPSCSSLIPSSTTAGELGGVHGWLDDEDQAVQRL